MRWYRERISVPVCRTDYSQASGRAPIGLVEATGRNIVWTQPEDVDLDKLPVGINRPGRTPGMSEGMISSPHSGVTNVVHLDGSVDTLSADIDPVVLKQLLTGQ